LITAGGETPLMRLPRERFTIWRMMIAIAAVALVLGILVYCLRWLQYPHIDVTIFNETSTTIRDVRVIFMLGERTAERLGPGGIVVAEIQSGGDACIFFSYRDSGGILRKAEPICEESGNRGFLELHVTNEGVRLVNGIYWGDAPPILGIRRVGPTGQMAVK
jgi:hypothetical protein